jgi:hypothetical protein
MNYFIDIDNKLDSLATRLGGKVTHDRPHFPAPIPERRIDWKSGEMKKAIIIQPTFTSTGVDLNGWNYTIVAWMNEFTNRKQYILKLVDKKEIALIQSSIDELLQKSESILEDISESDLTEIKST